jgi:hypothetical protein
MSPSPTRGSHNDNDDSNNTSSSTISSMPPQCRQQDLDMQDNDAKNHQQLNVSYNNDHNNMHRVVSESDMSETGDSYSSPRSSKEYRMRKSSLIGYVVELCYHP